MNAAYDSWAHIYDLIWQENKQDIEFYYQISKNERQPILEAACGTGRVAIPLACAGLKVVGIDISPKMLEEAEKKLKQAGKITGNIRFEKQDMRNFHLPEKFGACIIPFNAFLHLLSLKDQEESLRCVYNHLKAEGKLIFDIFVPNAKWIAKEKYKTTKKMVVRDDSKTIEYWFDNKYDTFNQTVEIIANINYNDEDIKKDHKNKIKFYMKYVYTFEMYHLLTKCNFKIVDLYGDFDKKEFSKDSERMIWVCEKV